jgi:hypothetical protein
MGKSGQGQDAGSQSARRRNAAQYDSLFHADRRRRRSGPDSKDTFMRAYAAAVRQDDRGEAGPFARDATTRPG